MNFDEIVGNIRGSIDSKHQVSPNACAKTLFKITKRFIYSVNKIIPISDPSLAPDTLCTVGIHNEVCLKLLKMNEIVENRWKLLKIAEIVEKTMFFWCEPVTDHGAHGKTSQGSPFSYSEKHNTFNKSIISARCFW